MEKSWENFWTTGKVEDYLSYKNSASNTTEKEINKEETKRRQQEGMKGTWDSQSL